MLHVPFGAAMLSIAELRADLSTAREIARKKALVTTRLSETAVGLCQPGLWLVEGAYARHRGTVLPTELRDAVRGIWRRPRARQVAELLLPPWYAKVRNPESAGRRADCTIAYFSNGGKWKLFDLRNGRVWTRVEDIDRAVQEQRRIDAFRSTLRIPAFTLERYGSGWWRREVYLVGPNLALCPVSVRLPTMELLIAQFGAVARTMTAPPDPRLTTDAVNTMLESAPGSIPAQLCARYATEIQWLGEELPLAPAHGDLSAQNVFVCEREPWVIDWDSAGAGAPLLFDVLYLATREAELGRPDLFEAFLDGRFDDAVAHALSECGAPPRRRDNLLMLLHAYVVRFHRQRRAGQRDANEWSVDAVWRTLRSYTTAHLQDPAHGTGLGNALA
jgi:hypothetical protein